MADANWLDIDTNINGNGNGSNTQNEFEVSTTLPLPLPHPDHSGGSGGDGDGDVCSGHPTVSKGCLTRRKMIVIVVAVAVIVGAAVGVSLAFGPSGKTQPGSSTTSASESSGVGASHSGGGKQTGKHKLDNTSIGNNRVPSPTPAGIQYANQPTTSPGPTPSGASEIAEIIVGVARNGGDEFRDANSYQSRAKQWVLTQSFPVNDASTMTTEQQAIQLYALACIYYATYSVKSEWTDVNFGADLALPGWYSSRGWLGSAEDVCSDWHGLTCDDRGRISKIVLDTNGLTGAFPPEVALLHESLDTIDLYNNILHNVGDEGIDFFGELTNLEYLYLGTTNFQYSGIPPAIGKLTKLKELDFSNTLFFGKLDGAVFENLVDLRYLAMDGNSYHSALPSELVQLPSLEFLYVGFSFVEDNLDFVSRMPKIRELWVDDNPDLKGTIPSSMGTTLASFSASNCGFTGSIPTEIGSLSGMVQLWLNDNELTGEIPSEFGTVVTLEILNLQGNQLEGEMPASICARKRPFGRLEELGADCEAAITCSDQCCTCCGDQCASR